MHVRNFCETQITKALASEISYEGLVDLMDNNDVQMAIGPGDFYSANEAYPWRCERRARNRYWVEGGQIVRMETSQDVVDVLFGKPKK